MPWQIEIALGPRAGEKRVLKDGDSLLLGRAPAAPWSFPEDPTMSSQHCLLSVQQDACTVADQGSANGTFVNGNRIQTAPIIAGDRLQAGTTTFTISIPQPPPFGSWKVETPAGWEIVPGQGIRRTSGFPSNVTLKEDALTIPLSEYVANQRSILAQVAPRIQPGEPIPVQFPETEEALGLELHNAEILQRQIYVKVRDQVGILTMTSTATEFAAIQPEFTALLRTARFLPS